MIRETKIQSWSIIPILSLEIMQNKENWPGGVSSKVPPALKLVEIERERK